jgi:hypothetical protein
MAEFLIPFVVEDYLLKYQAEGNMGKYGVFLEIYIKRNVLYLGIIGSLVLIFIKMYLASFIFLMLFIVNYALTINKWYFVF